MFRLGRNQRFTYSYYSTFNDLAGELETLGKASRLKRILWCDSVSEHISDIYHSLDEAVRLCDVSYGVWDLGQKLY